MMCGPCPLPYMQTPPTAAAGLIRMDIIRVRDTITCDLSTMPWDASTAKAKPGNRLCPPSPGRAPLGSPGTGPSVLPPDPQ